MEERTEGIKIQGHQLTKNESHRLLSEVILRTRVSNFEELEEELKDYTVSTQAEGERYEHLRFHAPEHKLWNYMVVRDGKEVSDYV